MKRFLILFLLLFTLPAYGQDVTRFYATQQGFHDPVIYEVGGQEFARANIATIMGGGVAGATPPAGVTAPTKYESVWNTTDAKTILNAVSINSGDLIVTFSACQDGECELTLTENGSATASLVQSYTTASNTTVSIWTYLATGNETITISVDEVAYSEKIFGAVAYLFPAGGHGGVGTSNKAQSASGDPAVTLSSVAANSAIVMGVGDWSAVSGTQTANTTIGSFTPATGYPGDTSAYGAFAGYYLDAGSTGNKTVGMTVPDGQTWSIVAVEVKSP